MPWTRIHPRKRSGPSIYSFSEKPLCFKQLHQCPYFQFFFKGLPLFLTACCGLVFKTSTRVRDRQHLAFVYVSFLLCAWYGQAIRLNAARHSDRRRPPFPMKATGLHCRHGDLGQGLFASSRLEVWAVIFRMLSPLRSRRCAL